MKSVAHQYEDKLLEFAYGELPQHEADAVDAHVRGCNRCAQSLSEIRGVRAAMAQLPMEPAPDAGLESLLAYAEQAAKRNAAASKPAPSIFKRFLMPLASLAALFTVGVVGLRASEQFDTSPASAVADQKLAAVEEANQQAVQKKEEAQKQLAQTQTPAALPPVVAAAAPQPEAALPANAPADPAKDDDFRNRNKDSSRESAAEELDDLDAALASKNSGKKRQKTGAKRGDLADAFADKGGSQQSAGEVWSPEPPKAARQSDGKRAVKADPAPMGNDEQVYRAQGNFSDVGTRAAKMERQELAKAPPPPPPSPPAEDRPTFGLGSSSPGSSSGLTGGGTRDSAPSGLSYKSSPAPVAPPPAKTEAKPQPAEKLAVQREREEREDREKWTVEKETKEKEAKEKESESRKRAEEERRAAELERPSVAQPMPSAAPPPAPAPSSSSSYSVPSKKAKSGYGIIPQAQLGRERSSNEGAYDEEALQETDRVSLNSDAKFDQRKRAESITRSVEQARVASSRGDRLEEINLLKQALKYGAEGYEKAESLKRICDAYEALGEPEAGDRYCDQLLREFPNTVAAKVVSERRKQVQRAAPSPKKPAASSERKALDFDDARPAEAAPAQSY